MSSYIGGLIIGNEQYKIGSTLYGVCSTDANNQSKRVVLPDFDQLLDGITVFIKFISGNTAVNTENSNVTLQFYANNEANTGPNNNLNTVGPISIAENFLCPSNGIRSFTFDNVNGTKYWHVNNNFEITESTVNGNIQINGQDVPIHGLGTAAYTNSTDYAPRNNPTFTGTATFQGTVIVPAVGDSTTETSSAATVAYVRERTAGLTGLQGAMHFKGTTDTIPPSGTYENGDVVLGPNHKEYVYNEPNWIELGDEGSFVPWTAIAQGTASYIANNGFTANTPTAVSVTPTSLSRVTTNEVAINTVQHTIPIVTQAGTAMRASVSQGILTLTAGTDTELNNTTVYGINNEAQQKIPTITVTNINLEDKINITNGTAASLVATNVNVLVPASINNP